MLNTVGTILSGYGIAIHTESASGTRNKVCHWRTGSRSIRLMRVYRGLTQDEE